MKIKSNRRDFLKYTGIAGLSTVAGAAISCSGIEQKAKKAGG
jgi:anaerobic selenocysteine-containing dehydrogenase